MTEERLKLSLYSLRMNLPRIIDLPTSERSGISAYPQTTAYIVIFLAGSATSKLVFFKGLSFFLTSTVSSMLTKMQMTSNSWLRTLRSTHYPKVMAESSFFEILLVSETYSNSDKLVKLILLDDIF